jgi:CRP/FNR family transcriptional regulator, cyclic AMP receptor protein
MRGGTHGVVNQSDFDRWPSNVLEFYVWKRIPIHHLQRLCAQASVAERHSSSRLMEGEAVMSRAPRSRPAKRSTNRIPAGGTLFDPAAFLATAANGRDISKYSKKAVIFAQGDDADAVFYIKKGKVKVAVISKQGKEAIVALLGPDEFVGEGCLIGQLKRLATASAMTECEIMRVEKTEIQRVLHEEPAFSQMFVAHVLARVARVEEDLVDQLFNSTEKRLARLLLMLANFGKEGKAEPILAKISQETLAEMIGTTRSRVSHFMNKFRQLGFIDYNGHLQVHNSLVGVLLADQPRTVSAPKGNILQ